jgi:NADH-quinone oxidoreductase subunit H
MASMQHIKGPNIVGLFGLLQPLVDGLKLMIKEPILPSSVLVVSSPIIYYANNVGTTPVSLCRKHP